MAQLVTAASAPILAPDDYFAAVLGTGREACEQELTTDIKVAGKREESGTGSIISWSVT